MLTSRLIAMLAAAIASLRDCMLPTAFRLVELIMKALETIRVNSSNMISPTTRVAPLWRPYP
ncbi:hypothetical protein D3C84_1086260 [compost metagenome]